MKNDITAGEIPQHNAKPSSPTFPSLSQYFVILDPKNSLNATRNNNSKAEISWKNIVSNDAYIQHLNPTDQSEGIAATDN